jgi:hypothetical protein
MKLFETLTEDTFLLYAANNYNNKQCTEAEEFYDDLNRFKYIKRLLSRYDDTGELQERLILNHIVVICNVFSIEAGTKMLWYKVKKQHWPIIKTMLVYLNYVNDNEKIEIPLNPLVVERLRHL